MANWENPDTSRNNRSLTENLMLKVLITKRDLDDWEHIVRWFTGQRREIRRLVADISLSVFCANFSVTEIHRYFHKMLIQKKKKKTTNLLQETNSSSLSYSNFWEISRTDTGYNKCSTISAQELQHTLEISGKQQPYYILVKDHTSPNWESYQYDHILLILTVT